MRKALRYSLFANTGAAAGFNGAVAGVVQVLVLLCCFAAAVPYY